MRSLAFPIRLWFSFILALLLMAGCRNAQQPAAGDGPQVLSTLPQGWTPMTFGTNTVLNRGATNWMTINIDNDLAVEYLLFFTYDNSQVGAIIYDQQTGATGVVSSTPVPAPNQPTGVYVPYQVEPSFWTRSETPDIVGYVAPPFTTADQIRIEQVERFATDDPNVPGAANPNPGSDVPPTNELIIYGGTQVISVVWWRNTYNGYGIAQMAASAGLVPVTRETGEVLRPLEVVIGETPLTGLLARSVLCREVRFARQNAGEPPDIVEPVYQSAVRYGESDGGIVFCYDTPPHPYYPEGVVLAYLRPPAMAPPARGEQPVDPTAGLLWSGMAEAQRAALLGAVDLNGPGVEGRGLIVRDLRAPAGVALAPDYRVPDAPPITTTACAEVVSEDGQQLRRLLFNLIYEPVQEVNGVVSAEGFFITGITNITNAVLNCALVIP
jgi:hypothetical protein